METINLGTVYLALDNYLDVVLEVDDVPADLSTIERMLIVDAGCNWEIDSDESPTAFDWTAGDGVLRLALGHEPVPAETYSCYLIVFDPAYPDGMVWGNKYKIQFKAICRPD